MAFLQTLITHESRKNDSNCLFFKFVTFLSPTLSWRQQSLDSNPRSGDHVSIGLLLLAPWVAIGHVPLVVLILLVHLVAVRVRFALCVHFRRSGADPRVANFLQMSWLLAVAAGVVTAAARAVVSLRLPAASAASSSSLAAPASASSAAAAVVCLPAFEKRLELS